MNDHEKLEAIRCLCAHEDTPGHLLDPTDLRTESSGLGLLSTWQVLRVLDSDESAA